MSFKDLILKKEERKFGDDKSLNIGLGDIYIYIYMKKKRIEIILEILT